MKRSLFFTLLIGGLFLLNNCSSAPVAENNIVDKQLPNTNSPGNFKQTVENGNVAEIPVVNSENANNSQIINPYNKAKKNLANSNAVSTEAPKMSFVPAPNNSEIGTTMSDKGEFIEIRVFKSDQYLIKTVRNANAKTITVYLKNGKKIEMDESKISAHGTASPQEILIAAGVLQKPDQSQTGGK